MTKRNYILLAYAILILPSVLYFLINGYWWLFDGNNPIAPKMVAAFMIGSFGTLITAAVIDLTREIR